MKGKEKNKGQKGNKNKTEGGGGKRAKEKL